MAKGDQGRAQNQINYQGGLAQNSLNNNQARTNQLYSGMYNNWLGSQSQGLANYDEIMNNYRNQQGAIQGFNLNPADRGNVEDSINRFRGFSDDGGFSQQNIQDMRARAIAPTRAVYSNAQRNVSRANTLAGGNLANTAASQTRLAREQSYAASDANVNANAGIAQLVQQGRLAGTQGLASTSLAQQNQQMLADQIRNQLMNANNAGMTSLYSASPGLASTFGNQVLGANAQNNQLQGLQNQLGLGLIGAQIDSSRIPGNYQQALGNIGGTLGLIGQVGGMAGAMGGNNALSSIPGMSGTSGAASSINDVNGVANSINGLNTGEIGAQTAGPRWYDYLGMGGVGSGSRGFDPMFDPGNPNSTVFNPNFGAIFGGGGGGDGQYFGDGRSRFAL